MIVNLRYHLDENDVLVRWNYRDVKPNVTATCQMRKRLNDELIAEQRAITLAAYHNGGGGCTFTLPRYPVYLIVWEDSAPENKARISIAESPRYLIKSEIKTTTVQHEVRTRCLFAHKKTVSVDALSLSLTLSEELSSAEAESLPGWVIRGLLNKTQPFFWPRPFKAGPNTFPPFEANNISEKDISFDTPEDETRGTPYENLFVFNTNDPYPPHPHGQASISPINLNAVAQRDESGHFPITCPFCLSVFAFNEPEFRSGIYEGEGVSGFRSEEDEKHRAFQEQMNIQVGGAQGAVLSWENGSRIKAYRLFGRKNNEWIDYDGENLPEDVVIAVRDSYGNESSDKICPRCHNPLPLLVGHYPSVILTLMGNTGSGKTVYIARLVQQLANGNLLPGYRLCCIGNRNVATLEMRGKYNALEGFETSNAPQKKAAASTSGFGPAQGNGFGAVLTSGFGPAQSNGFGAVPASGSGDAQGNGFGAVPSSGSGETQGNGFGAAPSSGSGETQCNSLSAAPSIKSAQTPAFQAEQFNFTSRKVETPDTQKMIEATARTYREPYVFQLSAEDESKGGLILSINDFPGEAIWDSTRLVDAFSRHFKDVLNHVDGIVFLFDPMTISRVENLGTEKKKTFANYLYKDAEEQGMFKQRPLEILESFGRQFYPANSIDVPVVYALSKSDAIRDHLPELLKVQDESSEMPVDLSFLDESANGTDSAHCGVDERELSHSDDMIRTFMQDPNLAQYAERLAPVSIWMCVSSTGIAPENGTMKGRYGGAVRIMDPLEWILFKRQQPEA